MNNNNNQVVADAAMFSSQTYCNQAKMLLENAFPRVSCKAIDIIFRGGGNYNFATTFHLISALKNSGDGAGQFDLISKHVKVFIKADRTQKQFEVNDKELLAELENIPERRDMQKYSCSLVRIPQGRVHMLCTYSDEDEETVHWMLLPLR